MAGRGGTGALAGADRPLLGMTAYIVSAKYSYRNIL